MDQSESLSLSPPGDGEINDQGFHKWCRYRDIKEIVEVKNPTAPLQIKFKSHHKYFLTVDEQFHTSLVELAKKLNKTVPQLIQDALNFYSNAAEEWEKNNPRPSSHQGLKDQN